MNSFPNFENKKEEMNWLNAIQAEICNPIIRTQGGLSSRTDQLRSAVHQLMEASDTYKGEIEDYSGNPVPIPGLKAKPGEALDFLVNIDIKPKQNFRELDVDSLKRVYNSDLGLRRTGLQECKTILSSEFLLRQPRLGEPQKWEPESFSPKETKEIRENSTNFLTKFYQPVFSENRLYFDYGLILDNREFWQSIFDQEYFAGGAPPDAELFSHNENSFLMTLAAMTFNPMPALYFRQDEEGQYHYIYNKMLYADLITVKYGVFAIRG